MTTSRRGALIVFEGVDRCGKTTQTTRLVDTLAKQHGKDVRLMRFPDRTTATGKLIDSYLKSDVELDDRAVHLLFAANRWEAAKSMRTALAAGTSLIVDRYSFSGVCFTAAKEGQDLEWCKAPEVGLPAPDVVLFLDLPVDVAALRGQFGEERYEKLDFQRKVYANFKAMATPVWQMVDAQQTIEQVAEVVEASALEVIERVQEQPLTSFWE